jgi:hypothetical protein
MLALWQNPVRLIVVRRGNPLSVSQIRRGVSFASLPQGLPGRVFPVADGHAALLCPLMVSLAGRSFPLQHCGI